MTEPLSNKIDIAEPGSLNSRKIETILVVDDEWQLVDSACILLHSLGYFTIKSYIPSQAIEILKSGWEADLVFCDMVLSSNNNGLLLVREIIDFILDQKILFTSAYIDIHVETSLSPAMQKLIQTSLANPYHKCDLATAISQAFND